MVEEYHFMKLFSKRVKTPPKDKKGSVTVIIAAAGSGTRLGGISKPLMPILGKCAIEYSLEVFSNTENVTRIVISTKKEDIPKYREIVKKRGFSKVVGIIEGGSTRQESVAKAFRYAFGEMITEFVAIHDAARPLITQDAVQKAIADAKKYGAAVCAALCPDTVKRAGKSFFVTESVSREGLYLIQTPQIFSYEIYSASLAVAERDGFEATDDSSLVENALFKIKITETSRDNIKLTYPGDVLIAEAIMKSREEQV